MNSTTHPKTPYYGCHWRLGEDSGIAFFASTEEPRKVAPYVVPKGAAILDIYTAEWRDEF